MQAGREVKFKAWLHEEKVMVDVIEINFPEKYVCFYDCTGLTDAEAFELMRNGIPNADCLFENCSLRQFTGLRDKNGKEIYEGDIIRVEQWNMNGIVNFASGMFKVSDPIRTEFNPSLASFMVEVRCEVIGNIYENPELLEVGN